MGWADKRIEQYRQGQNPTWLEKRMIESTRPVFIVIFIIADVILSYGFIFHDWRAISLALIMIGSGYIYAWFKK